MPAALVLAAAPAPVFAFLEGIGAGEMMLVAVIGLLLFGGKGLPDMARTLGKAMREFKKATANIEEEVKRAMNEDPAPAPKPKPRPRPAALPSAALPSTAPEQPTPPSPSVADTPVAPPPPEPPASPRS